MSFTGFESFANTFRPGFPFGFRDGNFSESFRDRKSVV